MDGIEKKSHSHALVRSSFVIHKNGEMHVRMLLMFWNNRERSIRESRIDKRNVWLRVCNNIYRYRKERDTVIHTRDALLFLCSSVFFWSNTLRCSCDISLLFESFCHEVEFVPNSCCSSDEQPGTPLRTSIWAGPILHVSPPDQVLMDAPKNLMRALKTKKFTRCPSRLLVCSVFYLILMLSLSCRLLLNHCNH